MRIDLDHALTADLARARLREQGFATLSPDATAALAHQPADALAALAPYWDDLPPDRHLRDGGHYRARRHGCAILDTAGDTAPRLDDVPHRAHWQSTAYNALHGGIERWFEPIDPRMASAPAWRALVTHLGACFAGVRAPDGGRWFVEAHPFRIDTEGGVGRPTIVGGETRVFAADSPLGVRFTLEAPWSALLLDDTRVVHESTPIQPLGAARGHRDTLVLTYRSGGFQAP